LAEKFRADAEAAILEVLRGSSRALTRSEVVATLSKAGVDEPAARRAWKHLLPAIRANEQVSEDRNRYRWVAQPSRMTAAEALQTLAQGRLPAAKAAELADIVAAAVVNPEQAARQRQQAIDGVRALAALAIEVEELATKQASARAVVHRVRARVRRSGLEPIESAGDETRFDPKVHQPIGRAIPAGTKVIVVRPGYVWHAPTEDVQLHEAVVQELD
jgi:hypothetical protein